METSANNANLHSEVTTFASRMPFALKIHPHLCASYL